MKIVFFGTSDFAIPSLEKMLESDFELLAVVTQPDRKRGRGLELAPPPVKAIMTDRTVPIYQPVDVSSLDMLKILREYTPDLFVVVAFGQILTKELLSIPKLYCINLHPSLLPRYRGAAPINWAIINGEKKTGVTIIKMNEKMDAGDIILSQEVEIFDTDTSLTLGQRLSIIGAELLLKAIDLIGKDKVKFTKQDPKGVTYAYKLKKEDGLINWYMPAVTIHNRIRGLIPWPGAYTYFRGRLLKIWESEYNNSPTKKDEIGAVIDLRKEGIIIGTSYGELVIKVLQLEGGKRLKVEEFLKGHRLEIGDRFG